MNFRSGKLVACAAGGLMIITAAEVVRGQQAPASRGPQAPAQAQQAPAQAQQPPAQAQQGEAGAVGNGPLAQLVRRSTADFRNVQAAGAAGYLRAGGCVSGPEEGAMGVHYGNASLIGDGMLDATQPEVLVYEPQQNGRLQLVAVEYLVLAEQWHENNEEPPVLNGQHFHFVNAPNRTGLPAYYELHVWAWKRNPHGTFTDWNPRVSCEFYNPQPSQ